MARVRSSGMGGENSPNRRRCKARAVVSRRVPQQDPLARMNTQQAFELAVQKTRAGAAVGPRLLAKVEREFARGIRGVITEFQRMKVRIEMDPRMKRQVQEIAGNIAAHEKMLGHLERTVRRMIEASAKGKGPTKMPPFCK